MPIAISAKVSLDLAFSNTRPSNGRIFAFQQKESKTDSRPRKTTTGSSPMNLVNETLNSLDLLCF